MCYTALKSDMSQGCEQRLLDSSDFDLFAEIRGKSGAVRLGVVGGATGLSWLGELLFIGSSIRISFVARGPGHEHETQAGGSEPEPAEP